MLNHNRTDSYKKKRYDPSLSARYTLFSSSGMTHPTPNKFPLVTLPPPPLSDERYEVPREGSQQRMARGPRADERCVLIPVSLRVDQDKFKQTKKSLDKAKKRCKLSIESGTATNTPAKRLRTAFDPNLTGTDSKQDLSALEDL